MITSKTTQATLREHLSGDAALLRDFAEVAGFAAVVATGSSLAPAAFVALIVKTAAAAIGAGTRFLNRLADDEQPALPTTYERFRVMFYVACQRAYIEALSSAVSELSNTTSSKLDKAAASHAKKTVEHAVVQIDEAEVRFRYSVDPVKESIPLFDTYGEWLSAALGVLNLDYTKRYEFVKAVRADAQNRLHVALSRDDAASQWMRGYLALSSAAANAASLRNDLSGIRQALHGWIESSSGQKQRDVAWRSYREMLQRLPDAKETMFNEDFGVRQVFVAPRVTYHRAGTSESGDAKLVPDLGTILGALVSTRVTGDDLIILSGGPGSGKSTLCRLLVSELAKIDTIHPIFLRLRRFKEGGDLSSFLAETLEREGLVGHIADLQHLPNVVLVLDGFDELVMASRARLRQFFRSLLDDVHTGPLRRAKVLVSGRDTLFPNGEGLPRGSHILSLQPFDKARVSAWGDRWRTLHQANKGKTFRPELFVQDSESAKTPTSALQHLVTWPLTLHLIARIHTAGKLDLSSSRKQDIQKAYLYRSILADTAARQIGQADGRGRLEPAKMREFLRSLAWEMHARGVDSMEASDVAVLLKTFYPNAGEAELSELSDVTVVNQPELYKGEDKGFEFVHKSFAEYLVAERIAAVVESVTFRVSDEEGRVDWRQNEREACRTVAELLAVRQIPAEIQEMLAPMLGAYGEFKKEKRVDEVVAKSDRIVGLTRIVERMELLYADFFTRDALATIAQLGVTMARQHHPLQLLANYGVGVVAIGTTATRELSAYDSKGRKVRLFHAEPYDGAFWRWLFLLSGWSPLAGDTSRVLEGLSLKREGKEDALSELSCPLKFASLEQVHGYQSELGDLLAATDHVVVQLLQTVGGLTRLVASSQKPHEAEELSHRVSRELLGDVVRHYIVARQRVQEGGFAGGENVRDIRYLMNRLEQEIFSGARWRDTPYVLREFFPGSRPGHERGLDGIFEYLRDLLRRP